MCCLLKYDNCIFQYKIKRVIEGLEQVKEERQSIEDSLVDMKTTTITSIRSTET